MTTRRDADPPDNPGEIPDEAVLWRRVHALAWTLRGDGGWDIESGSFSDSSDGSGMSVHREAVAVAEGLTMEDLLPPPQEMFGVVALLARDLRLLRQGIVPEPLLEDPTHAEVIGTKNAKTRRRIRDQSHVVRVPPCFAAD